MRIARPRESWNFWTHIVLLGNPWWYSWMSIIVPCLGSSFAGLPVVLLFSGNLTERWSVSTLYYAGVGGLCQMRGVGRLCLCGSMRGWTLFWRASGNFVWSSNVMCELWSHVKEKNSLNLSILLSEGKGTNKDWCSNGEWNTNCSDWELMSIELWSRNLLTSIR